MEEMNKVGLIIGDSPIIKKVEYELPYILNKHFSLGINRIIRKYTTSKHIFLDSGVISVTNDYPSIPVITLKKYNDSIIDKEKELIDTFSNKIDLIYRVLQDIQYINKEGELAWCGFTHDYAISYLISKGYNKIILIGAADFISGTHYSNDEEEFHSSQELQKHSIQFIQHLHDNNIAEFYTINEDTPLNINYISVEDLMLDKI